MLQSSLIFRKMDTRNTDRLRRVSLLFLQVHGKGSNWNQPQTTSLHTMNSNRYTKRSSVSGYFQLPASSSVSEALTGISPPLVSLLMQVASATLVIGFELPGPAVLLAAAPVFAEGPIESSIWTHVFFAHISVSSDGFPLTPAAASLGTCDHSEEQHQHSHLCKDGNFHHFDFRFNKLMINM